MPPEGFEPTISADERPKAYALNLAAPGPAKRLLYTRQIPWLVVQLLVSSEQVYDVQLVNFPDGDVQYLLRLLGYVWRIHENDRCRKLKFHKPEGINEYADLLLGGWIQWKKVWR